MPFLIGGLTGVLIAFLIGETPLGIVGFGLFGVIAAGTGAAKLWAPELFYWVMLGLLALFLVAAFSGVPVPRFLMMLPPVLLASRFVSGVASSLMGRSNA